MKACCINFTKAFSLRPMSDHNSHSIDRWVFTARARCSFKRVQGAHFRSREIERKQVEILGRVLPRGGWVAARANSHHCTALQHPPQAHLWEKHVVGISVVARHAHNDSQCSTALHQAAGKHRRGPALRGCRSVDVLSVRTCATPTPWLVAIPCTTEELKSHPFIASNASYVTR